MKPVGTPDRANRAGWNICRLDNDSIVYGVSAKGKIVKISRCPNKILTKSVLCRILSNVTRNGFSPKILMLGNKIESIEKDTFENPYMYSDKKSRCVYGGIKTVAIYAGSTLDNSIKMHGRYCDMFERLGRDNGLRFGYYVPTLHTILPYDYELYPLRRVTDYGGGRTRFVETYEYWSVAEIALLRQAMADSNTCEELYELARQNGVSRDRSNGSIYTKAYELGWRARR